MRPLLLICVLDSMTLDGPSPQTEYYTPEVNREQRQLDHRPFDSLDAMPLVANIASCVYPGCAVAAGPGSSGSTYGVVPKTKLNIVKRAFSVAAPTIWNQLPITIKSSGTIVTFRKNKTNVFEVVLPPNFVAVLCSKDDFCLSPFMISPNGFACCASELHFSRIYALYKCHNYYYYYYHTERERERERREREREREERDERMVLLLVFSYSIHVIKNSLDYRNPSQTK